MGVVVVECIAMAVASVCGNAGAKVSPARRMEGPQDSGDVEVAAVDRGVWWDGRGPSQQ